MYRIIAVDLDETLLDDKKHVSVKDRQSAEQLRKEGVKVVVTTGRGFWMAADALRQLNLDGREGEYVISYNGGAITENKGNRVLDLHSFRYDKAKALFERIMQYPELCCHIYTFDRLYVYNSSEYERKKLALMAPFTEIGPSIDFLKDEIIMKVIYMYPDIEYLKVIAAQITDLTYDLEVSYSSERYLEFNEKGIDKGQGLRNLARLLKVDIAETMAVGDSFNDLAMLEAAGLSVAVANCHPTLHGQVDVILNSTNNEDPLTEICERFIKKHPEG